MASSGLWRFQAEIVAAVVQVVRPVAGGKYAHAGPRGVQRVADRLALRELAVQSRREGRGGRIGDGPPGADEVRDAAAQEGLGKADAAVELAKRVDRGAQPSGFAGIEDDESRHGIHRGKVAAREHAPAGTEDAARGWRLRIEPGVAREVNRVIVAGAELGEQA